MDSSSVRAFATLDPRRAAVGVLVPFATLLWGCGSSPYIYRTYPPPPPPVEATTEAPSEGPAVYIIVQPVEEASPAAELAPPKDGWIPDGLPAENPFERSRKWIGDYDCRQGNTSFSLRILDVRGRVVRAVFDFRHAPSGAAGAYLITGTYDADTRRAHFEPTQWIVQPENYIMVNMEGEVALDGSLFAGKIPFPGCGAFQLKPTR